MTPEQRKNDVEKLIDTIRRQKLGGGVEITELKLSELRLSAQLGILQYEGQYDVAATLAQASKELKDAGAQSAEAAQKLGDYTKILAGATIALVVATFSLVAVGAWQAWETHWANNKPNNSVAQPAIQVSLPR